MNLARDLAMALDPVVFGHELGMDLDPWQADVARCAHPRMLLNCSRQSGKTQTIGLLAAHAGLYEPGHNILLLSPSQRQSSELFRRVTAFINKLDPKPELLEENKLSLEFANHSRIISLPASEATVRGFPAHKVIIDEASRVPDELYRAVRPMLATTNGQLVLMSTPFGRRGFFFDEWENGGDEWKRVLIPATMCPRITPQFLAKEKRALGELWFLSEYMCQFVENVNSVFRYEDVDGAFSDEIVPLFATAKASDEDSGLSPLFFAL